MEILSPEAAVILGLALVAYFKKRFEQIPEGQAGPFTSYKKAKAIVEQLVSMGYYQYALPADVRNMKDKLIRSIFETGSLSTIYTGEDNNLPKDHRLYKFDSETLSAAMHHSNPLHILQPAFEKRGLVLHLTKTAQPPAYGHTARTLTVNGKDYLISKGGNTDGWHEEKQLFIALVNDLMALQNKDERLYLINDEYAVFFTESQFSLLDNKLMGAASRPLQVDRWCAVMGVSRV